jgi:hypothetical protein
MFKRAFLINIFLFYIYIDNLNQGFITLKNLVLNYLGLSSIDQIYSSILQNGDAESKNSSLQTNLTKSVDKKFQPSELQRTGIGTWHFFITITIIYLPYSLVSRPLELDIIWPIIKAFN